MSTSAGSMRIVTWCHRCAGVRDRAALRAGLADGTIDLICSDHTPVDDDAKQLPFAESEPGATGLELLLPLDAQVGPRGQAAAVRGARPHYRRAGTRARARCGSPGRRRRRRRLCVRSRLALGGRACCASKSQGKNTPFLGVRTWRQGLAIPWSADKSCTRAERARAPPRPGQANCQGLSGRRRPSPQSQAALGRLRKAAVRSRTRRPRPRRRSGAPSARPDTCAPEGPRGSADSR